MTIYAVVKTENNVCDNMIVWDDTLGTWVPPADHYIVNNDDGAGNIGWTYDTETLSWIIPPEPVINASDASGENIIGPEVL